MSWYANRIFPYYLDRVMSRDVFTEKRKEVLQTVQGRILEIGVGTGLNFSCYPKQVKEVSTVDVNPGMHRLATKRAKKAGIALQHHVISAERLPFGDEVFDTVVSTWTCCSIPNLSQALKEFYRILKPDGRFVFIEHGVSRDPKKAKWQQRLTPLWKKFTCGCHLNRDIKAMLVQAPFDDIDVIEYDLPDVMSLVAHMYQGVARKR